MKNGIAACLLMIGCFGWTAVAFAEEGSAEESSVDKLVKQKGFVDTYINIQAQNLKDQYKLTPEQTKQVRQLISKQDLNFQFKAAGQLEKFERKMRKMLAEKKDPTIQDLQEVQEWSEKLYPLCQKTFKLMMMRTMKIQSVLTDEQKKRYQSQVDELELNSAELTKKLGDWKAGNIKVEDLKKDFGPRSEENDSDNVDLENDPDLKMYSTSSYDYWEMYVKTFIEAFELDKGQQTMAHSVLRDMKLKADVYRKDHAGEYAEAKRQIDDLRRYKVTDKVGGRNVMEVLAERKKRLEDIDKPLVGMFEELKVRLMKIPTDAQRKRAFELMESSGGAKKNEG